MNRSGITAADTSRHANGRSFQRNRRARSGRLAGVSRHPPPRLRHWGTVAGGGGGYSVRTSIRCEARRTLRGGEVGAPITAAATAISSLNPRPTNVPRRRPRGAGPSIGAACGQFKQGGPEVDAGHRQAGAAGADEPSVSSSPTGSACESSPNNARRIAPGHVDAAPQRIVSAPRTMTVGHVVIEPSVEHDRVGHRPSRQRSPREGRHAARTPAPPPNRVGR